MRLLIGEDRLVAEWVRRQIPHMEGADFGACTAVGVIDEDANILGGVVWHNYRPQFRTIEWSAAATTANWLSATLITDIMRYPFEQLGCQKIRALIPLRNERARRFHKRFGFKQEGQLRREFGSQDAICYGLLRSEWRKSPLNLERETHGQERTSGAAADRSH